MPRARVARIAMVVVVMVIIFGSILLRFMRIPVALIPAIYQDPPLYSSQRV